MAILTKRAAPPWPKGERLVIAGFLALGLLPALGGYVRLAQLAAGALTPENARFLAAPTPIVLHVVASLLYAFLGAFQFSDGLRRRFPRWHRSAGKLLVVAGMVVALSGLWMTLIYPITKPEAGLPGYDGLAVFVTRLVVGVAMAGALVLGYTTIRRGDVQAHRAWMVRAYALGMGAGTQAITHIPWFLFPAIHGETARALGMAAGWAINLAVAEWYIARKVSRPAATATPRP